MNEELSVEVIVPNPVAFYECMDCETIWGEHDYTHYEHRKRAVQNFTRSEAHEYLNVAAWVVKMQQEYGDLIHVRIIDAISLEGMAKSNLYGLNAYPAVVVDHRDVYNVHTLHLASEDIADLICQKEEAASG